MKAEDTNMGDVVRYKNMYLIHELNDLYTDPEVAKVNQPELRFIDLISNNPVYLVRDTEVVPLPKAKYLVGKYPGCVFVAKDQLCIFIDWVDATIQNFKVLTRDLNYGGWEIKELFRTEEVTIIEGLTISFLNSAI